MNEKELEMAEQFQADQLARSIRAASLYPGLPPKGECYNCDEPLPEGKKFCDADCEKDWGTRTKMAKQAPFVRRSDDDY